MHAPSAHMVLSLMNVNTADQVAMLTDASVMCLQIPLTAISLSDPAQAMRTLRTKTFFNVPRIPSGTKPGRSPPLFGRSWQPDYAQSRLGNRYTTRNPGT